MKFSKVNKQLKIKRYKSRLNPYTTKNYFDTYPRIVATERFRNELYKKYKNKCVVCSETLSNGEQIDLHHLFPRAKGGKYTFDNIIPIHHTCHVSITHARKPWFKFKL
jgi:RNA-directed DNA polymerase